MGLRCQIKYRKGIASVFNENGTPSLLYKAALDLTGNQQKSLDIWATANLDEFEVLAGKRNQNDEVSLEEVLKFYNVLEAQDSELSPSELFETKQFMQINGFSRLSDLRKTLNNVFRNSLKTSSSITTSNLYSAEELEEIDLKKINSILNKIDHQLLTEDIAVELEKRIEKFKNTEFKTIFGTYESVSQKTIDETIADTLVDFTEETFYDTIQELPYPDFVEKFYSNRVFAKEVISKFKGITKIPVLDIQNEELVNTKTTTYATVKNTLQSGLNKNLVLAELEYLQSIDLDIWNRSTDEIQSILGDIEVELVKLNLDVIGIKKLYKSREDVIFLLTRLNELLISPSDLNILLFSQAHDQLIPKKDNVSIEKLPAVYEGLTIVKLYSNQTDNELFDKFGLIKIAANTYHKIDRSGTKTDLYEYVYDEVKNDRLAIPNEVLMVSNYKDILNKPQVLEGISRFVNLRETRIISEFQEEISLYQVIFNHQALPETNVKQDIPFLTEIKTDEQYLKTDFVSDFYNYILREKLEDSSAYRNILNKFEINDQDIVLREPVESIQDLEYFEELSDYIRLNKSPDMKYLVETNDTNVLDDLLYLNMPNLIPEVIGNFYVNGDYLITEANELGFVKTRGKSYRKAMENPNVSLYLQIKTPQDLNYYTNNTNFSFDKDLATSVLNRYDALETQVVPDNIISDTFAEELDSDISDSSLILNGFAVMDSNITIETKYSETEQKKIIEKLNDCG